MFISPNWVLSQIKKCKCFQCLVGACLCFRAVWLRRGGGGKPSQATLMPPPTIMEPADLSRSMMRNNPTA